MKLGLYEQILNTGTTNELKDLNPDLFTVGKEALDVEEARKLLVHYISMVQKGFGNYLTSISLLTTIRKRF